MWTPWWFRPRNRKAHSIIFRFVIKNTFFLLSVAAIASTLNYKSSRQREAGISFVCLSWFSIIWFTVCPLINFYLNYIAAAPPDISSKLSHSDLYDVIHFLVRWRGIDKEISDCVWPWGLRKRRQGRRRTSLEVNNILICFGVSSILGIFTIRFSPILSEHFDRFIVKYAPSGSFRSFNSLQQLWDLV